jgi:hypothetical protein
VTSKKTHSIDQQKQRISKGLKRPVSNDARPRVGNEADPKRMAAVQAAGGARKRLQGEADTDSEKTDNRSSSGRASGAHYMLGSLGQSPKPALVKQKENADKVRYRYYLFCLIICRNL